MCSQLRQVKNSGQVEWVVEGTLQVAQVPVGRRRLNMGCFRSEVLRANKAEVLFGNGALVHGRLDASALFSGEDWAAVAVRTVSVLAHSVKTIA